MPAAPKSLNRVFDSICDSPVAIFTGVHAAVTPSHGKSRHTKFFATPNLSRRLQAKADRPKSEFADGHLARKYPIFEANLAKTPDLTGKPKSDCRRLVGMGFFCETRG